MKLNEIESVDTEQLLTEASKKQAAIWTALTSAGFGGTLVTSLIVSSGASVTVPTVLAGGILYFLVAAFSAIAAGISTLFVRGEKRDIYEQIKSLSDDLIEKMDRYETKYQEADEKDQEKIMNDAINDLSSIIQQIDILQSRLERLIETDEGKPGLFRSSFRNMLAKRLQRGENLQRVIRQVKREVDKMEKETPVSYN